MAARINSLFSGTPVLGDGAMGTMLLEGGMTLGDCLEELNRTRPAIIGAVHEQYLRAGAEIIKTHTFGANSFRLEHFGRRRQVRTFNLAAAALARQCVEALGAELGRLALVAGAIGPLGVRGGVSPSEARAAFAEQIEALADAGVDLLIAETMMSVDEAEQVVLAAREVAPHLKIAVLITVNAAGDCLDGVSPKTAAARLTAIGADAVGCNCSLGPASVLRAVKRMRAATTLPLVAMPSAGLPQLVDGRSAYPESPQRMAGLVHDFVQAGANWVGGCCGTTPTHIRAMHSALQSEILDEREAVAGTLAPLQEVA